MRLGTWARSVAGLGLLVVSTACGARGPQPGEGFIDVTGGRVRYRVVGSGPGTPLVVLHGGPGFSSEYLKSLEGGHRWSTYHRYLSRTLTPEEMGRAMSDLNPEVYRLHAGAERVHDHRNAQELRSDARTWDASWCPRCLPRASSMR